MKLYIVGFGCGSREGMTIEAEKAIGRSDLVVGYTVYTELLREFFPEKEFYSTAMRQEKQRVEYALEQAESGRTVSLICSGDSAVYGMAGLAFELSEKYPNTEIEPVAGVTAALSGGAILGAPLTHDFAVISLSDLLTPIEKIFKRLKCAAEGDFTIALYNPSSKKRADYLEKACKILLEYKAPDTVCGYVKNIGRQGQESRVLTLKELEKTQADMFTTVFIGNSETKNIGGKMVTPRGYENV
ncbi:MAG: precorrin-3B C(17)-methyltransferase [Ruminiclostridium sp.]